MNIKLIELKTGEKILKKKVLLVSCEGLGNGGVQAVLMSIVRNLSYKYIFDIVLFTDVKGYYEEEFKSYGGSVIRIPFYRGRNQIFRKIDYLQREKHIYKGMLECIDEFGPYCAIHCNNYFESAPCLQAAKEKNIPVRIAHVHAVIQSVNCVVDYYRKKYLKKILKYATHKIGCSKVACDSFFGKNIEAEIILNPYNDKRFTLTNYKSLKSKNLTITQIGTFCANKNQIFSIRIMKHILKKVPNAQLNLVGSDSVGYKSKMEKEIKRLQLESAIKIYSHDADTPKLLSQSHIALMPSLFEGFGIVVIEAQAMGVHCFASDSLPTLTNTGGCTYLPLSSGEELWANEIINWYQKNKYKPQLYDCSKFTEEAIIVKYNQMYENKN